MGEPQGRQRRSRAGRVAERDAHRRDAEQHGRPRRNHQAEGLDRLEARHDRHRAAGRESRDQPGRLSEDVRERRSAEHDVLGPEGQCLRGVPGGGADAAVRQDGSLGDARCPRGEEDHGRVVGVPRDERRVSLGPRIGVECDLRDAEPLGRRRDQRRTVGVEDDRSRGDCVEPLLDLGGAE